MGSPQQTRRRHRLRTQHRDRHPSVIGSQETTRARRPRPRRSDTIQTQDRHRLERGRLACLIGITALLVMNASPVSAHSPLDMSRAKYAGLLPDQYYDDVSRCETNTKLGQPYGTRTYTSPLGINRSTAHRWSGKRDLNSLTPAQIVNVADRIAFLGWTNKKGEYVWPVGPFGWGVVRSGCMHTLAHLCKSTVKKVQKYRARACRLWSSHG
jgi:hypothetical protein